MGNGQSWAAHSHIKAPCNKIKLGELLSICILTAAVVCRLLVVQDGF